MMDPAARNKQAILAQMLGMPDPLTQEQVDQRTQMNQMGLDAKAMLEGLAPKVARAEKMKEQEFGNPFALPGQLMSGAAGYRDLKKYEGEQEAERGRLAESAAAAYRAQQEDALRAEAEGRFKQYYQMFHDQRTHDETVRANNLTHHRGMTGTLNQGEPYMYVNINDPSDVVRFTANKVDGAAMYTSADVYIAAPASPTSTGTSRSAQSIS